MNVKALYQAPLALFSGLLKRESTHAKQSEAYSDASAEDKKIPARDRVFVMVILGLLSWAIVAAIIVTFLN